MAKKNAYLNFLNPNRVKPQSEPLPGQVPNSAGGHSYEANLWDRLMRFLVLGSDENTYYATAQTLTAENALVVAACLDEDGPRTVKTIVQVSKDGRAPKNTPAIFALALASAHADDDTRREAMDGILKVCRTGTHLFEFAAFVNEMRGWGRGLRRGIGAWYTDKRPRDLAYQLVKYRQRNGWTHTDLLRLAHPQPEGDTRDALFKWVTSDEDAPWAVMPEAPADEALEYVWAFEQAQRATDVRTVVRLIADYRLTREAVPTQFLNAVEVWEALLADMPMTAMLRNLGTMSKNGLLTVGSDAVDTVVERLADRERIRKARVHPIAALNALRVYAKGHGVRGKGTWHAVPKIVEALDTTFELAFDTITPARKRTMLSLDISGSMTWGNIAGVPGLTPREGSAAMALVTARTEPDYMVNVFSDGIAPVDITGRMRLQDVIAKTGALRMGGTDCALPMLYAREHKLEIDTFVIYTDSETWFGQVHPVQALQQYRQASNIAARLVVVGMVANRFTIADPNDAGMLDVVGFDTAAPNLIADFSRGDL